MVRVARVFSGVAAALAILTFVATAGAAEPHVFAYSFTGSGAARLGSASGIAIDNSAGPSKGDLYVADYNAARVEKFDAAGSFILMFGDEVDQTTGGDVCTAASGDLCQEGRQAPPSGAGPGAFGRPVLVAVDSSSGPSAGDVYVVDWETLEVSKFDATGHPVLGWGEEGHIDFARPDLGIAVGPDGKLYVQSGWGTEATIFVYGQSGGPLSNFAPVNPAGGGIAVDSSGRLYVSSQREIDRYDSSNVYLGGFGGSEFVRAIAIDPSDNRVFVKHYESIGSFAGSCLTSECAPEATFGNGYIREFWDQAGIAVDAATHRVFAASMAPGGKGEIAVFYPPGLIAEVTTLGASSVEDITAQVSGRVKPIIGHPVSACRFEYVTEAEYSSAGFEGAPSAPCAPGSQYSIPTDVSATLTGLKERTIYHYRVVASEGSGVRIGGDLQFRTTLAVPQVTTGAAANLRPDSATISGNVGPGRGPSVQNCYFQYVTAANFAATGFASPELSPCEPEREYSTATDVSAALEHLHASTTYRYRLVAWSNQGIGYGHDREFKTTAGPEPQPEPEEPGEPEPPHPYPPHAHCTRNACAHKLRASARPRTWTSRPYPLSYAWEAAVQSHGRWMPHTRLVGGCVATFRTEKLVVRLNGCHGHVKVRYVGEGTFTVVWQVFK
jgi:DNA-binding beta-propeller fold protein YncE